MAYRWLAMAFLPSDTDILALESHLQYIQKHLYLTAFLWSPGERRIRVHTLCLPVANSLSDIFAGADVQAVTGLLASMGMFYLLQ